MQGKLVYLVGSSGSGKDSLLRSVVAENHPNIVVAKRHITRNLMPDEDHIAVSENDFGNHVACQNYALHWFANGFGYGIEASIDTYLQQGKNVIVNGSRNYLATAKKRYPDMLIVCLWVSSQQLKKRLLQRAREPLDEIEARIGRNHTMNEKLPKGTFFLSNDKALEDTVKVFWEWLDSR